MESRLEFELAAVRCAEAEVDTAVSEREGRGERL